MDPNNSSIQNTLEQNTANMIFYEDSFAKTSFFTKEIPNWKTPIFYFDFDLQYTGFVNAGITPSLKNFNLLEGKKDVGRLVNSFLMLLASSAKHTKSTVILGILSRLNDEDKWVLYNTGRRVIDNEHFTKIQLTRSGNSISTKVLNSDSAR